MKSSQFDAKTYGVGQLITQRKLLRVPSHQRSYAWEVEAVDSFLSDIKEAYSDRNSDYFIGLIVLLGPEGGEWVLLDGQQRLTTTSLIFAAIRQWLLDHNLPDDANQIDTEYLGVRRLGGDHSSRMQLNQENQPAFAHAVMGANSSETLKQLAKEYGRRSSNRLLLEAAMACRDWIEQIASASETPERALFDLVTFLDSHVKVVCVDVSSETDAYVLFESLNDRGVELSALDLIKNHVISKDTSLEDQWTKLLDAIGDSNPDDFLKVFWTSRYGITQKSQIFRRVKDTYEDADSVATLMSELIQDATALAALNDDEHQYWRDRPASIRDQVFIVRQLGTKQVRPLVLAALRNLDSEMLAALLWQLVVAVVRFQVIGKGRTGVVEKVFGRVCQNLSRGGVKGAEDTERLLKDLFVQDATFSSDFSEHVDQRFSRIAYLLAEISVAEASATQLPWERARHVRSFIESSELEALHQRRSGCFPQSHAIFRQLGNYVLVKDGVEYPELNGRTRAVFEVEDIPVRSKALGEIAERVWKVGYHAVRSD